MEYEADNKNLSSIRDENFNKQLQAKIKFTLLLRFFQRFVVS